MRALIAERRLGLGGVVWGKALGLDEIMSKLNPQTWTGANQSQQGRRAVAGAGTGGGRREEVHTEGKPGPKPEQSVQDGSWLCASGEEDVCVWQTRQWGGEGPHLRGRETWEEAEGPAGTGESPG